ncbi:MAG: SirB2 family protein [Comamonadaceae bacterium]|nr:SirB2 family protein [Comamonadaceae bacterium]
MLIDSYPWLKHLHMTLVVLSGSLFAARALAVLLGSRKPLTRPMRRLSMGIDTGLLASALVLLAAYDFGMLHARWLQVKLLLLVAYIVLGFVALRARRRLHQWGAYMAALLCFLTMFSMARLKTPWGWLSWWM